MCFLLSKTQYYTTEVSKDDVYTVKCMRNKLEYSVPIYRLCYCGVDST